MSFFVMLRGFTTAIAPPWRSLRRVVCQVPRLSIVPFIVVISIFAAATYTRADTPAPLKPRDIARLKPDEARKRQSVKVRGTVTWSDADRGLLFIQDQNCGLVVRNPTATTNELFRVEAGQVVEVEGVTRSGRTTPYVEAANVRAVADGELPAPRKFELAGTLDGSADSAYWSVRGWVAGIYKLQGRMALRVFVAPGRVVEFMLREGEIPEAREWQCALVEGSGALSLTPERSAARQVARLHVQSAEQIRIIQPLPITTIAQLSAMSDTKAVPIRLRPRVVHHALGDYLLARDGTGTLRIPYRPLQYFNPGSRIEVFAFRTEPGGEMVLSDVAVKRVLADTQVGEPAAAVLTPAAANLNLPRLTNAAQVRQLSAHEASRGYPLSFTAVVTYSDDPTYMHFVQDDTAGIYVDLNRLGANGRLTVGQKVHVEGFSSPGSYAPMIIAEKLEVLGTAPLPAAEPVTFQRLMTGAYDSQLVTLRGVVRNHWSSNGRSILTVHTGDGLLKVTVLGEAKGAQQTNLIDSSIVISGVCATIFDDRRRLQNVEIHAPDWDKVSLKTQTGDPFKIPAIPISELFLFSASAGESHRVRLVGVVAHRRRDGSFFLQDAGGGIEVQPQELAIPAEQGATVEVVGFPQMMERRPTLQVAQFRKMQSQAAFEALHLRSEGQADEALHGTLTSFEGTVLRHASSRDEEWLNVQFGRWVVDVNLEKKGSADELGNIEPRTVVRCTGVYLAGFDADGVSHSFRMLLRSAADVQVLSRPPWWTTRRMIWALGISAAALLLALGWARFLRTQVQRRTRELAYERDLFKALLEHHPDAIYFKDLASRYVRLSRSRCEWAFAEARARHSAAAASDAWPEHLRSFEAFSQYAIGKTDLEFAGKERAQSTFEQEQTIIRTGVPLLGVVEHETLADGKSRWALTTKMPWKDAEGRVIGTFGVSKDVTALKESEAKLEKLHKQLLETSRQAGMAEVATSVLHNVGNVLNSVNVSANLVQEKLHLSRLPGLSRLVNLLREHQADLADFMSQDPRGRRVTKYLEELNQELANEQLSMRSELAELAANINHIENIVVMQQSYAKVSGVSERVKANELVEDALRLNAGSLDRERIDVRCHFAEHVPELVLDRHRVLQILVNLIRNAKHACQESGRPDKRLDLSISNGEDRVRITVADNGVGIAPENLPRIFNMGFTTRKDGHGFGLHSGALAAKELRGELRVRSDGLGRGATFTLELPATPSEDK